MRIVYTCFILTLASVYGGPILPIVNPTAEGLGSLGTPASSQLPEANGFEGVQLYLTADANPALPGADNGMLTYTIYTIGTVGGDSTIAAGTTMTVAYDFTLTPSSGATLRDLALHFDIYGMNGNDSINYYHAETGAIFPLSGQPFSGTVTETFSLDLPPGTEVRVQALFWAGVITTGANQGYQLSIPQNSIDFNPAAAETGVPEPGSALLLALGLGSLLAVRRRMGRQTMARCWLLIAAGISLSAITPQGAAVVSKVNAMLDAIPIDPAFREGRTAGREAEARAFLDKMQQPYTNCSAWLMDLFRDNRTPEVKAASQRCQALAQTRDAIRKSFEAKQADADRFKPMIYEWAKTTMPGGFLPNQMSFLQLHQGVNPNATTPQTLAELKERVAELERMDAACQGPYKSIAAMRHPESADKNPSDWCPLAAKRMELTRTMVINTASGPVQSAKGRIVQMTKELEANEGFLHVDERPIQRALFDREAFLRDIATQYKDFLAYANISDTTAILAPLGPSIDAMQKEIDRLAPRWKWPAGNAHDAAIEAFGRRQVSLQYPQAVVKATIMQDTTYAIRKNNLGVPLDRTRDGFVLYKMPQEKYCRQQTFEYTEKYAGGGRYEKPPGVDLRYIRFQPCQ